MQAARGSGAACMVGARQSGKHKIAGYADVYTTNLPWGTPILPRQGTRLEDKQTQGSDPATEP